MRLLILPGTGACLRVLFYGVADSKPVRALPGGKLPKSVRKPGREGAMRFQNLTRLRAG